MRRARMLLAALGEVLEGCGERRFAELVRDAAAAPDSELDAFLISNELWGGAGSIADQAGASGPRELRRPVERALIALGRLQLRTGNTNERTRMWVDAFRLWQKRGQ